MQAPPIEVVRVSYNAEYSLISGINAKLDWNGEQANVSKKLVVE